MASKQQVREILATLAAAYPTFALTKETVEVYCRMFSDVPAVPLQAAATEHMCSVKFFPNIAELRVGALRWIDDERLRLWDEVPKGRLPAETEFEHRRRLYRERERIKGMWEPRRLASGE